MAWHSIKWVRKVPVNAMKGRWWPKGQLDLWPNESSPTHKGLGGPQDPGFPTLRAPPRLTPVDDGEGVSAREEQGPRSGQPEEA